MQTKKGLNTRQWKLYKYLKQHKGEWKKLDDVMSETGLYNNYRLLKSDIRALKNSEVVKTVVSTNTSKGIKLATKKEYEKYSRLRWRAIVRMIKLQELQDKKAGLDGQYRIVFNQEKPMIESYIEEVNA